MTELFDLVESMSTIIAKEFQQRGYINVNFDVDSVEGVNPVTGNVINVNFQMNGQKIVKSKTIKPL
jgi:hypothetical protein